MIAKRWWPYAVGGALGVVAAMGAFVFLSRDGRSPLVGVDPSFSSGALPAVTASPSLAGPTLEPPVDGAIPAPAFPSSAIPWQEVGPGWFLLTYDPDTADDAQVLIGTYEDYYGEGTHDYTVSEADETLMLVSPTGELYRVGSLAGRGPAYPTLWRGASVDLFQPTGQGIGIRSSLDLASGVAIESPGGSSGLGSVTSAGGHLVYWSGEEGGLAGVDVRDADGSASRRICSGAWDASNLAPDGRRLVCIEPRADNRTDVVLYDVDAGTRTPLDIFKSNASHYYLMGWWDSNSVVVAKWGNTDAPDYWAYDVNTKKLTAIDPRLPDGTRPDRIRGLGGYRQLVGGDHDVVQGPDGDVRAELPCKLASLGGDTALTLCGILGTPDRVVVTVTDLATGKAHTVADYPAGIHDRISFFSYPGSPDVEWYSGVPFN